jgi:hypothetical protein
MHNLLDETKKNRHNDGGFKRLTEDDEEYGDGEEIARHRVNETRTGDGWLFEGWGQREPGSRLHFCGPDKSAEAHGILSILSVLSIARKAAVAPSDIPYIV